MAVACALALSAVPPQPAHAWPDRPVRIVVPATAGSSLDVVARTLSGKLFARWGKPVVIENKPGAGGLIGVNTAARAAPDGHVIALGYNGPLAFAPFLYRSMPYDAARDLLAVVMTSSQPNVLAIHAALPARSVRELVAWAQRRGGETTYASIGSGSSSHLAMELFKRTARFDAVHVPFNGSPAAALSVARGETRLLFAVASGVMPQVQSGQIRLIAVTSARRFPGLDDLPTMVEAGFPGFVADAWNGLVVAAGTPADVVTKIGADVNGVLRSPEVRTRFRSLGMAAGGGSPEAFRGLIDEETRRWEPVIRQAGIRID